MHKSVSLSLTLCLVLTGCDAVRRSPTWATVRSSRIDTRDAAGASGDYAERLSAVLKSAHVEHKTVTYEFRYRTRLNEEAISTRTVVLYRDGRSARHPWWLMDERLRQPVWLPGENLDHQLSFYAHRPASVVAINGQSTTGEGKVQVAEGPSLFARLWPMRKTERSRQFPTLLAARDTGISAEVLALFRVRHGSEFDPSSVLDRVKLEQLRRGAGRTVVLR
jgi:hypothetical protein